MYHAADKVWCAGGKISPLATRPIWEKEKKAESCSISRSVDYVSCCAMLIKRGSADKIGLLDQDYFAYLKTPIIATARKAGFAL
jgi:GT2 family glycosyltransferase